LIGIDTSVKSGWVKLVYSVKYNDKQTNKYHNIRTVPKSNRKIVEKIRQNRYPNI